MCHDRLCSFISTAFPFSMLFLHCRGVASLTCSLLQCQSLVCTEKGEKSMINPVLAIRLQLICTGYLPEQEHLLSSSRKIERKLGMCFHVCFYIFSECLSNRDMIWELSCKPRSFGVVKVVTDWKRAENNDSWLPLWLTELLMKEKYLLCWEQQWICEIELFWGKNAGRVFCEFFWPS